MSDKYKDENGRLHDYIEIENHVYVKQGLLEHNTCMKDLEIKEQQAKIDKLKAEVARLEEYEFMYKSCSK